MQALHCRVARRLAAHVGGLRSRRNYFVWFTIYLLLTFSTLFSHLSQPQIPRLYAQGAEQASVRISQIYGGGGNNDATLQSDFVELFNAGPNPVDLTGWSVQYAKKDGDNWQVTPLGSRIIAPYSYLLVKQASGEGGSDSGTPLEAPDVVGDIAMSAGDGKVALIGSEAPISGLADGTVIDLVGYGAATAAEGAPAAKLSNTTAAVRQGSGCTDTGDNSADFVELAPTPHNSASPANPCAPAADLPLLTETPPPAPVELPTETPASTETAPPLLLENMQPLTITITLTTTWPETETATPTPIDTPLETATIELSPTVDLPTATDTVTFTPTETPFLTDTPTSTPTPTALPGPLPRILISEFMADPQAVKDEMGEWVEIYNSAAAPANLRGWTLKDLGNDRFTIESDLMIAPGAYLVLARQGDSALNGGAPTALVYSGVSLANKEDELLLLAPDGSEVDRVVWGESAGLPITAGASYERTSFDTPGVWQVAQTVWSGSTGDKGSPGDATMLAPLTPTPTSASTSAATPSATDVATVTPGPPPQILITEFLADPKAVSDNDGEWLELYNSTAAAVNLHGWTLADLDNDRHTIQVDLLIEAGQYLVLARNGDSSANGGVMVQYVYSNMSLANRNDEILLLAPNDVEVDRVVWGDGTGVPVKAGASTQRTSLETPATWAIAQTPWVGSAGDAGSPGNGDSSPGATPTATPTPGTPGSAWVVVTTPSPLQIEEVLYSGSEEEFVALLNSSDTALDLTGWMLGDAETPGNGEGIYALPTGYLLAPGAVFVVARDGAAFRGEWGQPANAEFEERDSETLTLTRRRDLATGSLALNDSGDEVVLLNPAGELADAIAFSNGNYALLGLSGEIKPAKGFTLQRVPGAQFPTVTDVRHRFLFAPPQPFVARGLPLPQAFPLIALDGGLSPVWGSLGAQSNFSPDGTAPPHYLLAAAAAEGLRFLALADFALTPVVVNPNDMAFISAWRWQGVDKAAAIVYNSPYQNLESQDALFVHLAATGGFAQWQAKNPPPGAALVALAGDSIAGPADLAALYNGWWSADAPMLPAGNANPPLPGAVAPMPRYTGLAITSADANGIVEALTNRRGWLTSASGLWLTLQAEAAGGERRWMGSTIAPGNDLRLQIHYGDRTGEVAGLALWLDDKPIRQLDLPSADGRWTVALPAVPNSLIYVTASQADGDFAVTAPLRVAPGETGRLLLNEVLPAPWADHNGDGVINGDDEYIELYNPGAQPVSLRGWQLADSADDAANRPFTFGLGRFIPGGGLLLLRRTETRISLNNDNEYVRLLNPVGEEVDRIAWEQDPGKGWSLSRLPDGQSWQAGTATPGQTNKPAGSGNPTPPVEPRPGSDEDPDDDHDDLPPAPTLEPTYGQAGGPPASVAQSKLAGLEATVEFYAVVTAPPGLFNSSIYVADPAPDPATGPIAGIGINVYLRKGDYPPLQEGDRVRVQGALKSFRGEMELEMANVTQIWRINSGTPLQPLPVNVADIGESLEGRLVTLTGVVSGWQGDSIFLNDPATATGEAVRVTVRSSLPWKRPYVNKGQRWRVTGIVSQFAREAPWNGGYRVLVRYQGDLVKLNK